MSVSVSVTKQTVTIDDGRDIVTVSPVTQSVSVASTGPQGATGATGAKGDKGDTGDTGATGAGVAIGGTAGQVLSKIDSTNYNTQWVTPSSGGGVAQVLGTSPITASPSSGTVTVSVGTATTSAAGVVQLSDSTSTTSSVLAATPTAVKAAYDLAGSAVSANNYHAAQGYTSTSIETIARGFTPLSNINYANSGRAYFAMVRPVKDLTVGTASIYCVSVGTAMTTARMGLYTFDETSGTAILVARTANDTSIFGTAAVIQSRAFDTTGGYPATYTMTAGSTYAWAVVYVGTGIPFVAGFSSIGNLLFTTPRISAFVASQTDLPGTVAPTGISSALWGRLS